jgi:hypothetical protein
MFMSHKQNEGQNHKVMITNKAFENVAKFKHFGILLRKQN